MKDIASVDAFSSKNSQHASRVIQRKDIAYRRDSGGLIKFIKTAPALP